MMSDKVKSKSTPVINSQLAAVTNLWSKLTDNEKFSLYSNSYGENELLKSEIVRSDFLTKKYNKEKESSNKTISSLQKNLDLTTKRNEELTKKIQHFSEKNELLQNSILEIKGNLDIQEKDHEEMISNLQAEISQKDVVISNHEKTIEGYVNSSGRDIIDLEEKLSAKEQKIDKLDTTIRQMEYNQKYSTLGELVIKYID